MLKARALVCLFVTALFFVGCSSQEQTVLPPQPSPQETDPTSQPSPDPTPVDPNPVEPNPVDPIPPHWTRRTERHALYQPSLDSRTYHRVILRRPS